MEAQLTLGAVAAIWEDAAAVTASGMPLVLQVTDVRPSPVVMGCYDMVLSDGAHCIRGGTLFSSPVATERVASSLRVGDVVRFPEHRYRCYVLGDRRFILAEQLEVLLTDCTIIGNPKQYQITQVEEKYEELDALLESSSSELNTEAYSAGQGLEQLLTTGMVAMLQHPVMQVVDMMISGPENLEQFYLTLSDGVHTQNSTLATHLNHLVNNHHLRKGTIIRLLEFFCNNQSPSMIVITQLEVLQTDCNLIGSPKEYGTWPLHGEQCNGSVLNYAQPENAPCSSGQGLKWYLTQGTVVAMLENKMAVNVQPVMQVVDVYRCKGRYNFYCVLLSDGVYQEHAIIHPDINPLVEGNVLLNGSIVRILKFHCDTSQNCRIFFVILEVLQTECELIGSPVFHERGLKHKELYAHRAANVPVQAGQYDLTFQLPPSVPDQWRSLSQSHPGYNSGPG